MSVFLSFICHWGTNIFHGQILMCSWKCCIGRKGLESILGWCGKAWDPSHRNNFWHLLKLKDSWLGGLFYCPSLRTLPNIFNTPKYSPALMLQKKNMEKSHEDVCPHMYHQEWQAFTENWLKFSVNIFIYLFSWKTETDRLIEIFHILIYYQNTHHSWPDRPRGQEAGTPSRPPPKHKQPEGLCLHLLLLKYLQRWMGNRRVTQVQANKGSEHLKW